ncbi:hypothetical protein TRVA0_010S02586 [Trichomonascus vanleenenianus]|uniref:uncharacterized protein n=1 Tax=Trichomonascus vanleenenianus TaxID=2268995 RepID=UPI003EC97D4F
MSAVIPKITQLSPLVTRVLGCNPGKFTLQGTNTYLIGSGKSRILLDTGAGEVEYASLLQSYLQAQDIEISTILLSHWHPDHVRGLSDVVGMSPTAPEIHKFPHENDADMLRGFVPTPLKDEQVISTQDGSATLIGYHTPGHSEDHFVFYLVQENALFSADNVLGEGSSVFSDLSTYMKSLQRMHDLPGLRHMYPGHGPLIEDGRKTIQSYVEHRMQREAQIFELLRTHGHALSSEELVEILYPDLADHVKPAAERGIKLHLRKLQNERKVTVQDGGWKAAAAKL